MPKAAAITVSSCRTHIGRLCAALSALTFLHGTAALAATHDPALRRSEQLDIRRIGKVSEDERSVLRVEWRAGLSGVEEAGSVQDMLDSLRRMEGTVAEIGRLLRSIPVERPVAGQHPVVAAAAAEPPAADSQDSRLLLANIAAGILVALWWFRRRKPATYPEAIPGTRPETGRAIPASPAIPPVATRPGDILPAGVRMAKVPAHPPAAVAVESAQATPATEPRTEPPRIETALAPMPGAVSAIEQAAPPKLEEVAPEVPPPPVEVPPIIDFSLEEADPEAVARENARAQRPRKNVYPAVPERTPETNVEPTLQLAEIMLSMGLEQGAAQALLEYTEANPRQAVYHWLKLLGIYRKRGQQAEFMETAEKLRKHFNIQAEEWVKTDTGEPPTLEKFSRIAEQVQKIWSQPAECIFYLQHLLEDNRDGARAGFPQAVAEEILLLIKILNENAA
ncbi:MAG: hypothetical protein OEL20_08595 [Sulfuritalea sp.]|nr:hypothetical protein [Sulfuritalea sp.]